MQIPLTPINEMERLSALKSFNILDTQPEEAFDDYTFLASQICGTPIALISLVDETRQWFKSKVGLEVSQTARDVSICGHTILHNDFFEVTDTLKDRRFQDNPLITDTPNIRFYAGMPISTAEGYNLGTICVIDNQPRQLEAPQRDALKRIAKRIMAEIEQRSAKNSILQLNHSLYENANFIQTLIDNVPALIGYWNKNSECIFANATYQKLFGLDPQAMRGKHYLDIFPKEMTAQTYPCIQKGLLGERQMVEVSRDLNGNKEYGVVYYTPHFDADKNVQGVFALGLDITTLKKAEEKLKLSEKALESTHEGIFITNANLEFIYFNAGFTEITGYSAAEALGKRPNLLKSNQHSAEFYSALNNAVKAFGFWQGIIVNRHKEGALYSVLMTIDSIKNAAGEVSNYVASMIDITDSQKTKAELTLSNDMLKRTGKIANVGGWEFDWHTQIGRWTDQMFALHEIDNFQTPDFESALLFLLPEYRDSIRSKVEICIKDGIAWEADVPIITAKGRHRWIRAMCERVDLNGVPIKLAGTCQDVTEQKLQEQENINREVNLRNSLVREVHHHIKNNIQGNSGLLFNAAEENPLLLQPINVAISKLNSIAVIHGLQGKNIDTLIELNELVYAISQNIENVLHAKIAYSKSEQWAECYLAKNEAVPIALILNELITNAHKHGVKDCPIHILSSQTTDDIYKREVLISISNRGEFNRAVNDASSINQNGLKLVRSLMPKSGAYLSFLFEDNESQVTLMLKYPIITFR